tara:strand:- start:672 stop:1265 length:594 start_codon:yes stop_codon:yes gene_type:complete
LIISPEIKILMRENIFFDFSELSSLGERVIIGKTVRIRYPKLVNFENNIIIDDFCYISTRLNIKSFTHISSGVKIIGGKMSLVEMENFSTLAPNVVIAAESDDYSDGIATPMIPLEFKGDVEYSNIKIPRHCIIGANSTVLPNSIIGEGTSIGANSLVKGTLDSWSIYAGCPARKIGKRNKKNILELESKFHDFLSK